MEFKAHDYSAKDKLCSLTRVSVSSHPLCSSLSPSSSHAQDHGSIEFFDPLRAPLTETLEPVEDTPVTEKLPATSGEPPANLQSDELNDSQKLKEVGFKIVSQQEYIKRLHELKDEIMRSWNSDDRVTTLKLSIKVARLLMDTSVAQFYPTLFVLAADIMDMLGDLVWDRIKQKAEFSDDGTKICSLPDDFDAKSICFEAKETCNNWFRKISSIHELLPRIYLEIAILPCWRFLHDDVINDLMRLVTII